MNRSLIFIAIVILGYITVTMAASKSTEAQIELAKGNVALCRKIYETISKKPGNIFYSPASLEFALALLYVGTEGETAAQIRSALMLPESKEKICCAVSSTLEGLAGSKNVTLKIADGLFTHYKCNIKSSYIDMAKKYFASQVTNVNFESTQAVETINAFVAKETCQKIQKLFEPGGLDVLTRVVIVNAIYFKGDWALKFDPAATFKGDFHLNKTDKVKVDFMKQENKFRVGNPDDLNATVVVLPYKDEKISMVLIVPNEVDGLKSVEEKIVKMDLAAMVKDTYSQDVILTMPKFKLEQTLELKDLLSKLGMSEMFTDKANLSGITDEPLKVSDVVQKSYLEVNEEGAEAAAATGIIAITRMMPLPPITVTLDSPFSFFLFNNATETVLFMGRMSSP